MKKLLIFVIILALIYAGVKLSIKSPDQSIPSATEGTAEEETATDTPAPADLVQVTPSQISAKYSGYGPAGKEEHGAVTVKESSLVRAGDIFSGSVVFDMNSITSVPVKEMLIDHLKSRDFFDVANYPTATFAITDASATQLKGNLTLRGVTQAVTLPVAKDASGAYTSTVRVNMELFGIKQAFTDKEFVLELSVK